MKRKTKLFIYVFAAIAFLTLMQQDIEETSTKSYLLLDAIFNGTFPVGYPFESAFYIPVHITFAIWNLPFWILHRFGISGPSQIINLLWAKSLVVIALIGVIYMFNKILDEAEFTGNKEFWSFVLFTSMLVFPPVFAVAQYDSIGLFFGLYGTLLAIRCEDDKLSWKSLLLLSFSVSFKIFYLFPTICIIFVKNRKLKKIISSLLSCLSISVVFVVLSKILTKIKEARAIATAAAIVQNSPVVVDSAEISVGMAERLFKVTFPGGYFNMSIIFVLLFGLYFAMFIGKKPETKKEKIYMIAFSCSITYLILIVFAMAHVQWSIFPGVFTILLLALSSESNKKSNYICEEIFELSLLLQQFIFYPSIHLHEIRFDHLLLKNLNTHFFSTNLTCPSMILELGGEPLTMILASLTLVAAIALFVINNPWKVNKNNELTSINNDVVSNNFINFRTFILSVYVLSSLLIRLVF